MAGGGGAIKAESAGPPERTCLPSLRERLCRTGTTLPFRGQGDRLEVKGMIALTKKVSKLTNVKANNGAPVLAVFTASLRSLLIAFV